MWGIWHGTNNLEHWERITDVDHCVGSAEGSAHLARNVP